MQMKNPDELMIIVTAEGTSSWLREKLHPSSWVRMFGEGLIGDYASKMRILRQVDNRIAGWLGNLNQNVKDMEAALRANRLPALALILGEINHKLKSAVEVGKEIEDVEREALEQFDESGGSLSEDLEQKLAQAGWWEDKKREWVARRFENKEREKRSLALRRLVDITRQTVSEVQEQLSVMGAARSAGRIGMYIEAIGKISSIQRRFHSMFVPIYSKYLAPIVKRIREQEVQDTKSQKIETEEKIPEKPVEPPVVDPKVLDAVRRELTEQRATKPQPSPPSFVPSDEPVTESMPLTPPPNSSGVVSVENHNEPIEPPQTIRSPSEPVVPSIGTLAKQVVLVPESGKNEEPIPETVEHAPPQPKPKPAKKRKKSSEVDDIWLKQINAKFYSDLEKVAQQNNPYLLGWMLTKHADLIAEVDEIQSLKLLTVAESILNDK